MSKCISSHGEYSDHTVTTGEHCDHCGELDMDAHDRAVKAEALREAAEAYMAVGTMYVKGWLLDRADEMEAGA